MKWVVAVLTVLLLVAVALGAAGYASLHGEITTLQDRSHHATYAPYSFAEELAGRDNSLMDTLDQNAQADSDLSATVDCIKMALIDGGSVVGC